MKLAKVLKLGWVISCILGALVASLAIYAAWQHNPQQAFHSVNIINWRELSLIWFSWFLTVTTVVGGIASSCIIIAYKLIKYTAL